jgi:sialate O-acetylesterase
MTYPEADLKIGPAPWPAPVGPKSARHPGSFFEAMILRIAPYTLRGVIFYQGEADTDGHQKEYGHVFESMIKEWRDIFFDDQLPFIFCQLPMYISKQRKYMDFDDMSWPVLREQQQIVAIEVPNVYMAVIVDCGEFNNLFPADKKTPGDRLALLAEKFVYGFEQVDAVSPFIIDARRGEGVEISFGGDYLLLNLATGFGPDDSGFEVAGEDGKFFPAEANVDFDGKTVLLSCHHVEFPSKVRYAFFSYGPTPLHAQNGLTATPFQIRIDKDLGGA